MGLATCRYSRVSIGFLTRSDAEYRGTSRIRNSAPLGPYRRTMPRALGLRGGVLFLLSEVPLYQGLLGV